MVVTSVNILLSYIFGLSKHADIQTLSPVALLAKNLIASRDLPFWDFDGQKADIFKFHAKLMSGEVVS